MTQSAAQSFPLSDIRMTARLRLALKNLMHVDQEVWKGAHPSLVIKSGIELSGLKPQEAFALAAYVIAGGPCQHKADYGMACYEFFDSYVDALGDKKPKDLCAYVLRAARLFFDKSQYASMAKLSFFAATLPGISKSDASSAAEQWRLAAMACCKKDPSTALCIIHDVEITRQRMQKAKQSVHWPIFGVLDDINGILVDQTFVAAMRALTPRASKQTEKTGGAVPAPSTKKKPINGRGAGTKVWQQGKRLGKT